jgi:hypothetical protein
MTKIRTYDLQKTNDFVVTSIGLLRSIRLIPEEMFGVKLEIPPLDIFINGIKIDRKYINDTSEDNFFDFACIRRFLRTNDPYNFNTEDDLGQTEEDNYEEQMQYYNLEQTLVSGDLDAMAVYKISDEDMMTSVFTPYAIIKIDGEDNYFDSIKIEEEYWPR